MQINIDHARWWETPLAAFIFFTRLPFWRLHEPPRHCYKHVVEYWPLTGWLTGGMMGLVFFLASQHVSMTLAVLLAVGARMLVTGALHEDGLADFFDGFGGGTSRERILGIMKDSHIGTYGVLGLIVYLALLVASLTDIPAGLLAFVMLAADPFCKMVSGQIIMFLPYARREEEAKAKTVYVKYNLAAGLRLAVAGLLPMVILGYVMVTQFGYAVSTIEMLVMAPCFVFYGLYMLMKNKLHGYTGDCCGALFLLTELSFYLTFVLIY